VSRILLPGNEEVKRRLARFQVTCPENSQTEKGSRSVHAVNGLLLKNMGFAGRFRYIETHGIFLSAG